MDFDVLSPGVEGVCRRPSCGALLLLVTNRSEPHRCNRNRIVFQVRSPMIVDPMAVRIVMKSILVLSVGESLFER